MDIKPEIIEIIDNHNNSKNWQEIINNDKITYELTTILIKTLEKILGNVHKIQLRHDLLRMINSNDIILALGGNKNQAFCKIINLIFEDNEKIKRANIFISWQDEIDLKKKKSLFKKIFGG